jgi:hypothetical protein
MGVKLNNYGTGLFGFGTTMLDPIMPVRFLADPAFVLITQSEAGTAGGAKPPVDASTKTG